MKPTIINTNSKDFKSLLEINRKYAKRAALPGGAGYLYNLAQEQMKIEAKIMKETGISYRNLSTQTILELKK